MNRLPRPNGRLLTMEEAEKLLSTHIDDINEAVRAGLTTYQQIPPAVRSTFHARTAANVLNDLVISEALKRFSDQEPAISINQDYEGTLFVFGDTATVRFKKVKSKLQPRNIKTKRQMSMDYQRELPGISPCTLLSVAYLVNEEFTQVIRVHVVCWNGERRQWVFTISEGIEPYLFQIGDAKRKQKRAAVKSKSRTKKQGG